MSSFSTPLFLFLFLPVFFAFYYLAGSRGKVVAAIAGSLIFYASANLRNLPVMLGLLLANYWLGRWIAVARGRRLPMAPFWIGIAVNIGTLIFFKGPFGLTLPLGLSYVSFQLASYLIDVYKGTLVAESDFLKFSFYVLLFPKILVGPIVRYSSLKDRIGNFEITPEKTADGIRRVIRGLAKKTLIADFLAKIVNPVFALASPTISPPIAWLVLVGFALQLFFDFSGLTDMAIGLGKMMGLPFIENFDFPYISKSISEFWRRWHISLSSWFRDYVFFPLERRRSAWHPQPVNVLIVFALTGLWHGISWNYLTWGLIHGVAISIETSALGRRMRTLWPPLQHLYALGVLLFGWIFFRSPSLHFALSFLRRLAGYTGGLVPLAFAETAPLPIIDPTVIVAFVVGTLLCLPVGRWLAGLSAKLAGERLGLKMAFQIAYDIQMLLLFAASVAAAAAGNYAPGIYDRF